MELYNIWDCLMYYVMPGIKNGSFIRICIIYRTGKV